MLAAPPITFLPTGQAACALVVVLAGTVTDLRTISYPLSPGSPLSPFVPLSPFSPLSPFGPAGPAGSWPGLKSIARRDLLSTLPLVTASPRSLAFVTAPFLSSRAPTLLGAIAL